MFSPDFCVRREIKVPGPWFWPELIISFLTIKTNFLAIKKKEKQQNKKQGDNISILNVVPVYITSNANYTKL